MHSISEANLLLSRVYALPAVTELQGALFPATPVQFAAQMNMQPHADPLTAVMLAGVAASPPAAPPPAAPVAATAAPCWEEQAQDFIFEHAKQDEDYLARLVLAYTAKIPAAALQLTLRGELP